MNPQNLDPFAPRFIIVNDGHAFNVRPSELVGYGKLAVALFHRRLAGVNLEQIVRVRNFDPFAKDTDCRLASITVQVSLQRRGLPSVEEEEDASLRQFDVTEMQSRFIVSFDGQMLTEGQTIIMDFHGIFLLFLVTSISLPVGGEGQGQGHDVWHRRGVLTEDTAVHISMDGV
ncbi:transport between ER and Golgi ATPase protein [Geranomyces variabilis]|uniref:Transport between ER and Golgi ATPase protein n=1 Tax=Geranomyces variabilis TaxID=109894 RepID=A0AAD5TJS6_9FUNG|nr:transport between ER and Golgi ATPase protein [Geranomyces variabilis]